MKYSAAQAAKEVGRSTATITRAIEKGKLSAAKDENGAWQIDPAELHRVFERKPDEKPDMQRGANPQKGDENRGLERLVDTLQEQLRDMREDRESWKQEADNWRQQAERMTLLLSSRPPEEKPPAPEKLPAGAPVARGGGLWSRLWGRPANN